MTENEREMIELWKNVFNKAKFAGEIDKAYLYLDVLYDWLSYRGVDVLSDIEFENLHSFIMDANLE